MDAKEAAKWLRGMSREWWPPQSTETRGMLAAADLLDPPAPKVVRWERTGEYRFPEPYEWIEGQPTGQPAQMGSSGMAYARWILRKVEGE